MSDNGNGMAYLNRASPGMSDQLQIGREHYERRRWSQAYHTLVAADQSAPLDVDDLDRLASCAYLMGRDFEFLRLLERLHRAHVDAGERSRAARCAFWLGLNLLFQGALAQSNAWIARGHRLVDGRDCVEHGYLLLPAGEAQLREGRADAAYATAAKAAEIGERFREADLVAAARHGQGRALIQQGQVMAGLALLDEMMLAVIGGELSPIMTGLMYCSVIEACRETFALSRAREWTFALSRWCEQQSEMVAFTGTCLVHRAEIMQFHGAWPDAMAEAWRAYERSAKAARRPPGAALYLQAEIHRLRGEFPEADQAYRHASRSGCEPQPGLALLLLAQGRTDAAAAASRRLVSATTDCLQRARLLPAHLEIMLAIRDIEEARRACLELQSLADRFGTDALRAMAAQAHGAVELADGDARSALAPLRRAFDLWERSEAPYDSARARVLIGLACRTLDDEETAALEWSAARSVFERLGARPELARLDEIDKARASRHPHPLTARELDVLRRIAAGSTNKAIAAALCLSERTVDRHVSNILSKLDVPTRAAAIAYAYDHKFL
jgi:DNA-binding CsgD family transcriptional regulator